ncbi:MAG: fibronectin type III domain-containing protein, partial [Acidobacteria bacterium]|nr:fibronectin type III domain-containing protein [Acidobacteriota bacterium]
FVIADERCRPQLTPSAPGDPFRYRQLRSFNGIDYEPGQDVSGPFQIDFTPTVETPIYIKVRPYDWNLNFGVDSLPIKFIGLGLPLPAPRIVSIFDAGNGRLKIIFKSLAPDRLIGFTLYKQYQGPDDADPTPREFACKFSTANLGNEYTPGSWAVKAGAKPLAELPGFISTVDPVSNTFVYYNDLDGVYVMQANVGDVDDLVLSLHAVGWSGKEGLTIPTPWDGWIPGDKIVDWPSFRTFNLPWHTAEDNLSATHYASPSRVRLDWNANPQGCENPVQRPFVVFRRKGAGAWHQISPPFICTVSGPTEEALSFTDSDVEPGRTYQYRVIRVSSEGEFQMTFGPATVNVP